MKVMVQMESQQLPKPCRPRFCLARQAALKSAQRGELAQIAPMDLRQRFNTGGGPGGAHQHPDVSQLHFGVFFLGALQPLHQLRNGLCVHAYQRRAGYRDVLAGRLRGELGQSQPGCAQHVPRKMPG